MNAENERIKLKATFYNNLAVGAAVAGLLVPYIALYPKFFSADALTVEGFLRLVNLETIIGMAAAGIISFLFRSRADAWIRSLDDEDWSSCQVHDALPRAEIHHRAAILGQCSGHTACAGNQFTVPDCFNPSPMLIVA
jgi:hypothetical protein